MIYTSKINPVDYSALKDLQIAFGWSNDQLDYLVACMIADVHGTRLHKRTGTEHDFCGTGKKTC